MWVAGYGYDANGGGWRIAKHPRMMADVNGDGRDDVVGFGNAGTYVSTSTGTSFLPVSYTHLRAHETVLDLVCRLLLDKKKNT